ncbi:hypothetical protein X474_02910 [Dethiosulfatarculus sandiegensis]|uniref:Uncharacterized protein n=1 Tax=Dethiosulfatarculus sandiegensis TaxID=1429043 RepID=A0A0D2HZM9_9BACT|nr:hypothetical protein X474_02910 [Dethiosulfatarculus sandiegensis]
MYIQLIININIKIIPFQNIYTISALFSDNLTHF